MTARSPQELLALQESEQQQRDTEFQRTTPFGLPEPTTPPPPRTPRLDPRKRVQNGWEVETNWGTAHYPDGTLPAFDWAKMGFPDAATPFFTNADRSYLVHQFSLLDPALLDQPELTSDFVHRFETLAEIDPTIIELFINDSQAAFALTDQEWMQQAMQYQHDSAMGLFTAEQEKQRRAAFYAAREAFLKEHGNIRNGGQQLATVEANVQQFDAGTVGTALVPGSDLATVRFNVAGNWGDAYPIENLDQGETLQDALGLFEGRGGVWAAEGNNLAMRLSDETNSWTALIRLDEGTVIEDHHDAVWEYVRAITGLAHGIDTESDIAPGHQTMAGTMWEGFGDTVRWVESIGDGAVGRAIESFLKNDSNDVSANFAPPPQPSIQEQEENRIRAATLASTTVDHTLNIVLQSAQFELGRTLKGGEVILAADSFFALPENERAELGAEVANLRTEEALKLYKEQKDRESILGSFVIEEVVTPAVNAAIAWDHVVHSLAIGLWDGLIEQGLGAALQDIGQGEIPRLENPVDIFQKAVGEATTNTNFAEYFGWDPDSRWGQTTNLAVSIGADPITWFTVGGAASFKYAAKAMTDPALAGQFVRQPRFVSLAKQVVKHRRPQILAGEIGRMNRNDALRLVELAKTNFDEVGSVVRTMGRPVPLGKGKGKALKEAKRDAVDEILNIFERNLPANGGKWVPLSPTMVTTRQGIEGIGAMAARLPGESGPVRNAFIEGLMRAQRSRSVSTTMEGMLDDAIHTLLVPKFHASADDFARGFDELLTLYDDVARGNPEALGALANKGEKLRKAAAPHRRVLRDLEYVKTTRDQIRKLRLKETRHLRGKGKTLTDPELQAIRDQVDALEATLRLDDMRAYDAAKIEDDLITADQRRLGAQAHALEKPGNTAQLDRWWHEQYDDWADRLGIGYVDEAGEPIPYRGLTPSNAAPHPHHDGLKRRDWSVVTGQKTGFYPDLDVSRLEVLASGNKELADAAAAMGVLTTRVQTVLPVSPQMLVAFSAMQNVKGGRGVWKLAQTRFAQTGVKGSLDNLNAAFAVSVLMNPQTPLKTHLDEVIRFAQRHGFRGPARKALLQATRGIIPGRLGGTASRRASRFSEDVSSPIATRMRPWDVVTPDNRGHWQAAERYLNGSLLEDPVFSAYTRAISEADEEIGFEIWREWFEETGVKMLQMNTVKLDGEAGRVLTAELSFRIMRETFDNLIKAVPKAANRTRVREAILKAAREGGKVTDSGIYRMMGPVPGQVQDTVRGSGFVSNSFDFMYGAPQRRRGAAFYDYYYDYMDDTMRGAHQGRILGTSESVRDDTIRLLRDAGIETDEAAMAAIVNGQFDPVVQRLVRDNGMILERDLEAQVANFAARNTDSLMYTFGAVSAIGRKSQRVYPFGRAQLDFLNYWGRELMAPTQLTVPFTSKVFTPAIAGKTAPVNLRLWDRMAKLGTFAESHEAGQGPEAPEFSPEWAVDTFTFLPTRFDEGFLLDVSPSVLPVISWSVNFLDRDHPARDFFEEFHPSHRIFSDFENHGTNWVQNLFDSIAPNNPKSMRGLLDMVGSAMGATGLKGAGQIADTIRLNGEPPYMRDHVAVGTIAFFEENPIITPDDTNDTLRDKFDLLMDQAMRDSYGTNAKTILDTNVPLWPGAPGGGDLNGYARTWAAPIADNLAVWLDTGLVTPSQETDVRLSMEKIQDWLNGDGTVTRNDLTAFSDAVFDTWGQLPRAERARLEILYPGIRVNLVSTTEVDLDRVPDDPKIRAALVGDRLRSDLPAEQIRDIRIEGRRDGWIRDRDQFEVFEDRIQRGQSAAREYLSHIFEDLTGKQWGAPGQTNQWNKSTLVVIDKGSEHWKILEALDLIDDIPAAGSVALFPNEEDSPAAPIWTRVTDIDGTEQIITNAGALKAWLQESRNQYTYRQRSPLAFTALEQNNRVSDMSLFESVAEGVFGWQLDSNLTLDATTFGSELADWVQTVERDVSNIFGIDSASDWPEFATVPGEFGPDFDPKRDTINVFGVPFVPGQVIPLGDIREEIRQLFRGAVTTGFIDGDPYSGFTEKLYADWFARDYGPLDWEAPQPPALDELENAMTFFDTNQIRVVDGDGLAVGTADGEIRFRLIGINAPEIGMIGEDGQDLGRQAAWDLQKFLDQADSVTIGVFDPEVFGRTQRFRSEGEGGAIVDNERAFVWLYVNGKPVYDPSVFTAVNIRGVEIGTRDPINYFDLWQRGGEPG